MAPIPGPIAYSAPSLDGSSTGKDLRDRQLICDFKNALERFSDGQNIFLIKTQKS